MSALTPARRQELREMLAETRWRERIEWGGTVGVINTDEILALIDAADEADRLRKQLALKTRWLEGMPFCPDHRDKVSGKPCRECRIERLEAALRVCRWGCATAEEQAAAQYGPDWRNKVIAAALAGEGRPSPLADPEIARDTILQHTDLSRTPDDD